MGKGAGKHCLLDTTWLFVSLTHSSCSLSWNLHKIKPVNIQAGVRQELRGPTPSWGDIGGYLRPGRFSLRACLLAMSVANVPVASSIPMGTWPTLIGLWWTPWVKRTWRWDEVVHGKYDQDTLYTSMNFSKNKENVPKIKQWTKTKIGYRVHKVKSWKFLPFPTSAPTPAFLPNCQITCIRDKHC